MDHVRAVIQATVDVFKLEFTIYGFTMSMWQVFLFTMVACIIVRIIWEVFS